MSNIYYKTLLPWNSSYLPQKNKGTNQQFSEDCFHFTRYIKTFIIFIVWIFKSIICLVYSIYIYKISLWVFNFYVVQLCISSNYTSCTPVHCRKHNLKNIWSWQKVNDILMQQKFLRYLPCLDISSVVVTELFPTISWCREPCKPFKTETPKFTLCQTAIDDHDFY